MKCLYCGQKTQVVNSRGQKKTNAVWRRRQCLECRSIVTSTEQLDLSKAIRVEKASSVLESFKRDVLFISIYDCLKHRKDAAEAATELIRTTISKLLPHCQHGILKRADIVRVTQEVLRHFDRSAGVQYAAYHPSKVQV